MRMNSEASRASIARNVTNMATVIDLLDLDRGQLIATRTFDAETYLPLDGELLQLRRLSPDGIISFDIYRLTLTER